MKAIVFFLSFICLSAISRAQISDSSVIKKLTINGYCLCNTTVSALKQLDGELKEVSLEEMDNPPGCYGQDSRFVAEKGYSFEKSPGMIFQKDQQTEQISKIRLTKEFKGQLPDGKYVDLTKLTLKNLFNLYPQFKDNWGSRGCSKYWKFSNDTISFYVKINTTKLPQFPIDETYYLDKQVEAVDLVMSCYSLKKDKPDVVLTDESNDPVFFMDSIKVNKGVLMNYDPSEIASVTVYKDSSAIRRGGILAKNGLIYIETKEFAKKRYWSYLKAKSKDYAILIASGNDNNIQYILNKRLLKTNFEGDLASINDKIFKSIEIISKEQLKRDYGVSDKDYGVVIYSDAPSNLHNSKDKF